MADFNGMMNTAKSRWGQVSGGGMRADAKQPNETTKPVPGGFNPVDSKGPSFDRGSEAASVGFYQNAAKEGVNAIGQGLAFDFRRELGSYLGGLNSIGALRSGAVESGANDIMRTYADRVGAAASTATLGAIGYGAQGVDSELQRQQAAADRKQANKSSIWGGLGSLAGAAVGAFL